MVKKMCLDGGIKCRKKKKKMRGGGGRKCFTFHISFLHCNDDFTIYLF